jgi:hypothetical protein
LELVTARPRSTFLPKAGRVSAMVEAVATRLTAALGGVDGSGIGNAGGNQSKTLATANLPPYTPAGTATFAGNSMNNVLDTLASSSTGGGGFGFNYVTNQVSKR